ncbi:hypothetical protein HWV62_17774 [Athelia sp. TMB]|nr:hypothetical protein HWV62_17774 [Athelia sp. TMB]
MAPPTFVQAKEMKPCAGARMREKGVSLSNAFRQALGLPLIEKNISPADAERMVHGGLIRLMPGHRVGDDAEGQQGRKAMIHHIGDDEKSAHHEHDGKMQKHHKHHAHHAHHGHRHHASFAQRLNRALMTLGPWEGRAVAFVVGCGLGVLLRMLWVLSVVFGRAVAFVVGCGLGVLLRMLWVLSVVFVRALKGGNNDEETEYREIVLITEEQVVLAPPQYEYVDEKAPLEDVKTASA